MESTVQIYLQTPHGNLHEEYVKNYLEIRGKEMSFVNQIHNNI